jgi:hypothetical protein
MPGGFPLRMQRIRRDQRSVEVQWLNNSGIAGISLLLSATFI